MNKTVLITGAAGFVGRAAVDEFVNNGWSVRAIVRDLERVRPASSQLVEYIPVGDIANVSNWSRYCSGCDVVVHLAARAHEPSTSDGDFAGFERINCDVTVALADAAMKSGIGRFIFVSSAGVMGDFSQRPFTESDTPAPVSVYAKSKLKAELALSALCGGREMELTILRPTLIYGPGNPGNLERLVKMLSRGFPLPFGSITSKRSLLEVMNFGKIIFHSAVHPAAAGRTYLVSDGEDVTTTQLMKSLAVSIGKPATLFPFPEIFLRLLSSALGRRKDIDKMLGSHQVDSALLRRELGIGAISTTAHLEMSQAKPLEGSKVRHGEQV